MVKITLIIDDKPGTDKDELFFEHGLSMYVEFNGSTILYDTGMSGRFLSNAEYLGLDIGSSDFVFISHGHYDHIGGVDSFLSRFGIVPVYLSYNIAGNYFYSSRTSVKKNIGVDNDIFIKHADRFRFLSDSIWLTDNIASVKCDIIDYPRPKGNRYLSIANSSGEGPDKFSHELSLAIKDEDGLIIISACSHCGVLNIIESCRKFTGINNVKAFVGGTHFIDGADHSNAEINDFLNTFVARYHDVKLYTGHCTGDNARRIFKEWDDKMSVDYFYVGKQIVL